MSLIYNSAYAIFYRQRKVFKTSENSSFLSLAIFTGAACKIKESP